MADGLLSNESAIEFFKHLVEEAMGVRLARALQAEGSAQREALRRVGDHSLFLVGFFSDSLSNRLVDVDYYISLGGSAYGHLANRDEEAFADVFGEISDRAAIGTNRDLLRLYDRWVRTGSPRHGNLLTEMGIMPSLAAPA